MIGAVHAAVGAAIGTFCRKKSTAFAAGFVSHAVCDAVPHHDFPPKVEVPLMAAAVLLIGKLKGFDSPEFWGALGAISPDSEHGLAATGLTSFDRELFPTHMNNARLHGRCSNERLSQAIIAGVSALVLAMGKPKAT
jgi:hypothetical protein